MSTGTLVCLIAGLVFIIAFLLCIAEARKTKYYGEEEKEEQHSFLAESNTDE